MHEVFLDEKKSWKWTFSSETRRSIEAMYTLYRIALLYFAKARKPHWRAKNSHCDAVSVTERSCAMRRSGKCRITYRRIDIHTLLHPIVFVSSQNLSGRVLVNTALVLPSSVLINTAPVLRSSGLITVTAAPRQRCRDRSWWLWKLGVQPIFEFQFRHFHNFFANKLVTKK